MVSRLDNRNEDCIPLGIASSVAYTYGYSWQKTLELAKKLNLSVIQLHINQFEPDFNLQLKTETFDQLYVHLNSEFNYSHPFITNIGKYSRLQALIQHEKYIKDGDINFLSRHHLPLALENDNGEKINGFITKLESLMRSELDLHVVIDYTRFVHQFHNRYSLNDIFEHVVDILNLCKVQNIPVLLHTIDISSFDPHSSNWLPVFEGLVSWDKLFSFVIESSIPVKAVIFEYEDFSNTEKSVYSLREWFKKMSYARKGESDFSNSNT